MRPILVNVLDFPITSYGVAGAVGYVLVVFYVLARTSRLGLPRGPLTDVLFYGAVAGVVGARALFMLQTDEPVSWFDLRGGGLVFYGALLALPIGALVAWARRLPLLPVGDEIAVALPLGHAVARIGCLLAGCCWGTPTDLPWGVTYTSAFAPGPPDVALHPAVVYEAIGLVALSLGLAVIAQVKQRDGQVLFAYLAGYAVLRAFVEMFRGDPRGLFLQPWLGESLSFSQGVGLVSVGLAAVLFLAIPAWRGVGVTRPIGIGQRAQ